MTLHRTLALLSVGILSWAGCAGVEDPDALEAVGQVRQADTLTGLVANWRFDEGSGTSAADSSGGNTGTLSNGPSWVAGKVGPSALSFDGVNDEMRVPGATSLNNLAQRSVCVWLYPRTLTQANGYNQILTKQPGNSFELYTVSGQGKLWIKRAFSGGYGAWSTQGDVLVAGAWTHLCVTYDQGSTTNLPLVYKDGSPVTVISSTTPVGTAQADTGQLCLGSYCAGDYVPNFNFDDLRVYNRILPAADVQALAGTAGTCTPESNAAFCSRLAKSCGAVTALDNCGTSRSAVSCGSCPAFAACTANVCTAGAYPLSVSADRRHLVDRTGTPFLINGDAAWSMMVAATEAEAETYFADRQARGFNVVAVNLIEHQFKGDASNDGNRPFVTQSRDGDAPFTTVGNFTTPNEAYFAHVDRVLARAAAHGILVLLFPSYLGYGCGPEGWCQEMLASSDGALGTFGQYLGNRYKGYPNVIWVHGGDTNASTFGALGKVRAVVNGIKAVDGVHLHSAHCSRQSSALDCYDEPWLDLNTTYSDCTSAPLRTFNDYSRARVMPFFFIEGDYENAGASAACLRSQAYRSVLGGSIGHVLGNQPLWRFATGWQSALGSPGSMSMTTFGQVLHARAWQTLTPDYGHTVLTQGFGNLADASYVATARTPTRDTVLSYLPGSTSVTVAASAVNGTTLRSRWVNPAVCSTSSFVDLPTNAASAFTSAGEQVLVLDNAALGLPAPGCSCAAESNASFCARLGKSCGAVTAPDNCGTSRTVSSCGTCTSPLTCGGSGTANVCGQPGLGGLVLQLGFNEGSGLTASDASGNANTGTLGNGASWVTGHAGSAVFLDGVNDEVRVPASASLNNLAQRTVCLWVSPRTLVNATGYNQLLTKGPTNNFELWTVSGSGKVWMQRRFSGPAIWTTQGDVLVAGTWTHLCVAYDQGSTANVPVIYQNGNPVPVVTSTPPSGTAQSDNGDLCLGSFCGGSYASPFNLDDFRIYNRVLAASEVQQVFTSGQ